MASKSKKRVELVTPIIKKTGEKNITFEDVVSFINGKKHEGEFKDYELKLLNTTSDEYIVGIIITGQNKNLPPKKNKKTGEFFKLGIDIENENLSFGNIFLYDSKLNVLFYEVNVNGCYLNKLGDYFLDKWNIAHEDNQIDISFATVSRKGEYSRMLKMTYYKEVSVEFANPTEIIQSYKDDDSSMFSMTKKYLNDGNRNNSDTLVVKFSTFGKKTNKTGLTRSFLMKFVNSVRYLFNGDQKKNITALKVRGYFTDPESPKSIQPINLIADTFNIYIRIENQALLENIQEIERKNEIEKLYIKHKMELKSILNKD